MMRGVIVAALLAGVSWSAQPTQAAEPDKAAQVGPIRCYNLTGPRAGKFHCPVLGFGLNPFVLVVANDLDQAKADSPLAKLLADLDALATANPKANLGVAVIFAVLKADLPFDETRAVPLGVLETFAKEAKIGRAILGVTKSNDPSLTAYGIEANAPLTVIVCDRLLVKNRYSFTADQSFGEGDVTTILKDVSALVTPAGRPKQPGAAPADR
jgi:hypothetical protein